MIIIIIRIKTETLLKPAIAELMRLNVHFFTNTISEWNKLDSGFCNATPCSVTLTEFCSTNSKPGV